MSYKEFNMRINARLEDNYEEKFLYIQQLENKNRTEVLKEALDDYFSVKLKQKGEVAWEKNQKILEMVGGIAEGDGNLSETYKEFIYRRLKEKHDIN